MPVGFAWVLGMGYGVCIWMVDGDLLWRSWRRGVGAGQAAEAGSSDLPLCPLFRVVILY